MCMLLCRLQARHHLFLVYHLFLHFLSTSIIYYIKISFESISYSLSVVFYLKCQNYGKTVGLSYS
jgi:hypothetical protein